MTDKLAPRILSALRTGDSTVDELYRLTGLPSTNIRGTLNALKRDGKVEIVGTRHAMDALGRPVGGPPANVWGSVDAS